MHHEEYEDQEHWSEGELYEGENYHDQDDEYDGPPDDEVLIEDTEVDETARPVSSHRRAWLLLLLVLILGVLAIGVLIATRPLPPLPPTMKPPWMV